jgi:hypothetical protein
MKADRHPVDGNKGSWRRTDVKACLFGGRFSRDCTH